MEKTLATEQEKLRDSRDHIKQLKEQVLEAQTTAYKKDRERYFIAYLQLIETITSPRKLNIRHT
jgi:hypothetical protein